MAETRCVNCGDPDAELYELLVRNTNHKEVPLCDGCYEALQNEVPVSD